MPALGLLSPCPVELRHVDTALAGEARFTGQARYDKLFYARDLRERPMSETGKSPRTGEVSPG